VFWASNNLFRLFSHLDVYDVGFAALLVDDADSTMVTSMRHSLVNRRFDQDSYLLAGFIDSQDSA
jgi:hypothetical protein